MANVTDIYHAEINNFLKTVTIQFKPLSTIVTQSLKSYIDSYIDTSINYYKLRLLGQYIPGDEPMYVTSIDTGEKILFKRSVLDKHPRTAAVYKIPNVEYDTLCKRYSNQQDLIKSIVYPVTDLKLLETDQTFSYVGGDTSLLQSVEAYSIIEAIMKYCHVVSNRWWIKEYCYEEGYSIALYAMFWQFLPLICFTKRMTNIKTGAAHPYHVWEYLMSKGMDDYRDVLTTKQSTFLYRNMDYILANKGTASNLLVLSDYILSDFNITLYGKHIYQQQIDKFDECRRTPEIISVPIVSYDTSAIQYENSYESISTINSRMVQKGIEYDNTVSYTIELEKTYGEVEEDRLPTKLVELKKDPVNTVHKNLFLQFIIETLIYRLSMDNLSFNVSFQDRVSDTTVQLHVTDAFLLLYYSIHKAAGTTPIYTPKYGLVRIPYKMKKPSITEFHKQVWINDIPYDINTYLNLDKLLSSIPWVDSVIKSKAEFSELIYNQFTVMMTHFYKLQTSAELLDHRCMMAAYHTLCMYGNLEKELTSQQTYIKYFSSTDTLTNLSNAYKDVTNEYWGQLATDLFISIIDVSNSKFKSFIGSTDSYSTQFETMTSLLIQLSSHNITFLGTARETSDYMFMTPFVCHADTINGSTHGMLDINTLLKLKDSPYCTTYDTVIASLSTVKQYNTSSTYENIYTSDVDMSSVFHGETKDKNSMVKNIKITYEE